MRCLLPDACARPVVFVLSHRVATCSACHFLLDNRCRPKYTFVKRKLQVIQSRGNRTVRRSAVRVKTNTETSMNKSFLQPTAIALTIATASLFAATNAQAWTLKEAA